MLAIREFASFYEDLRTKYLAYLSKFSDWESYLEQSKANACDPNYYPEILLQEFKSEVDELYFEQNEFLRPYHPTYSEFQEFRAENEYETFKLKSKLGGIRIQVELFNIAKDELYFPRIKWIASVHSALHSLGMLVHVQKSYDFKHHGIALHEVPRLTHVGDREFTMYCCQKLSSPMVILSREENTANALERNGVPKIGAIEGRWCSRTEKIEPKRLFMERFFFSVEQKIEYVFNREQLLHILDQQKMNYPSKLRSSKKEKLIAYVKQKYRMGEIISSFKSQYLTQDDEYQLSDFNKETLNWELQEDTTSRVTLYDKVRNVANRIEDYQEFGVKPINNVVEFVGIMKHQSPNRALQNPSVKVSNISSGKKQFWTFEHYPIFHLSYQELRELVDPLPLQQNPYERMYRDFITEENREIRFGCSLCPFKTEGFYKKLQKDHPEIYYYARFLKLLASAKNLLTEDREYCYFQSSEIM